VIYIKRHTIAYNFRQEFACIELEYNALNINNIYCTECGLPKNTLYSSSK